MTLTLLISNEPYKTWELEIESTDVYLRREQMAITLKEAEDETADIRYKESHRFYWQITSNFKKVRHEPEPDLFLSGNFEAYTFPTNHKIRKHDIT